MSSICFVHGLGGHLTKTWSRGDCCWPKDLLPNTISNDNRIKIRVLSYGYNAQPVKLSGGSSNGRVQGFARTLMDELGSSRRMLGGKHCSRRIIFVGHSLGGLVIKSTICQSKQYNPGELERNIFDCTAGTVRPIAFKELRSLSNSDHMCVVDLYWHTSSWQRLREMDEILEWHLRHGAKTCQPRPDG